ncbi:MAG: NAD(P)H-dependent glycerol-3-phosphate dehydrogenase, partial [Bacteroidota bacterium]
MNSNPSSNETVGVIGAGSFGTALANLLVQNKGVLLYSHRPEAIEQLRKEQRYRGRSLDPNIRYTSDLAELAGECELIFPVVPSGNFRNMLKQLSPFLRPYHRLIHGTKGLDLALREGETLETMSNLELSQVCTMSEVIRQESVVRRVGCVAGPNLASEIADGQPAATVVASHFDEVIRDGKTALRTSRFRVHGNHELLGIELAGVLKNIMAIAAGILNGMGYGENTRSMLVSQGLAEMIYIGKGLGAPVNPFLGLAGIGDLVATCNSPNSRNFTVGFRLGKGEPLEAIQQSMEETAEGLNTVRIVKALANSRRFSAPISLTLHRILYEGMDIEKGVRLLM